MLSERYIVTKEFWPKSCSVHITVTQAQNPDVIGNGTAFEIAEAFDIAHDDYVCKLTEDQQSRLRRSAEWREYGEHNYIPSCSCHICDTQRKEMYLPNEFRD